MFCLFFQKKFIIIVIILKLPMKLQILSVFILSVLSLSASGQSLKLDFADSVVNTEDLNPISPVASYAIVRNISNGFRNVKVKRQVISQQAGHVTYFCWSTGCYGPNTNESPATDNVSLDSQMVDSSFKGYVVPNGVAGITKVRYCFQTTENPLDEVCYTVTHSFGATSVMPATPVSRVTSVQAIYDPGSQTIHVDVNGGKIDVMNMLGQQVVLTFRYDGSGMSADASSLKTGYYFLFGRNENGPWSARVVVSKQ
jgi:hypothetical protein